MIVASAIELVLRVHLSFWFVVIVRIGERDQSHPDRQAAPLEAGPAFAPYLELIVATVSMVISRLVRYTDECKKDRSHKREMAASV